MKKAIHINTALGPVGIAEESGAVTNIFFGNTVKPKEYVTSKTPLLNQAERELKEYLSGDRRVFDFPIKTEGTDFEQSVWAALLTIPYGQVATYGQIARQIGHPAACRAVGRANGLNPISIVVPCHRVIGASGQLTGYAGGLPMKKKLLELEGAI